MATPDLGCALAVALALVSFSLIAVLFSGAGAPRRWWRKTAFRQRLSLCGIPAYGVSSRIIRGRLVACVGKGRHVSAPRRTLDGRGVIRVFWTSIRGLKQPVHAPRLFTPSVASRSWSGGSGRLRHYPQALGSGLDSASGGRPLTDSPLFRQRTICFALFLPLSFAGAWTLSPPLIGSTSPFLTLLFALLPLTPLLRFLSLHPSLWVALGFRPGDFSRGAYAYSLAVC